MERDASNEAIKTTAAVVTAASARGFTGAARRPRSERDIKTS